MFLGPCFGGCGGWAIGAFVLGLLVDRNRSRRAFCQGFHCGRCCCPRCRRR